MRFWVVRGGRDGERETYAVENSQVVIGFDEIGDVRNLEKSKIEERLRDAYPDRSSGAFPQWAGMIVRFRDEITKGDIVAIPLKTAPQVAIGVVDGNYRFDPKAPEGARHNRRVKWLKSDIARVSISDALSSKLSVRRTVYELNLAEHYDELIRLIGTEATSLKRPAGLEPPRAEDQEPAFVQDIEYSSRNDIIRHIFREFPESQMETLIAAVFSAAGYVVNRTPASRDGGVDLLAGSGLLGFDHPQICIEVKAWSSSVRVEQVRSFDSVLQNTGADYGIYVAWSGYSPDARKEFANRHFKLRLWTADDVLDQIFLHYDKLPPEVRSRIPLKRMWVLNGAPKAEEV